MNEASIEIDIAAAERIWCTLEPFVRNMLSQSGVLPAAEVAIVAYLRPRGIDMLSATPHSLDPSKVPPELVTALIFNVRSCLKQLTHMATEIHELKHGRAKTWRPETLGKWSVAAQGFGKTPH